MTCNGGRQICLKGQYHKNIIISIFYPIQPTRNTDLQSFQLLSYLLVRSSMHNVARELLLCAVSYQCCFHPFDSFVVTPGVTIISELSETKRLELPNERQQIRQKKSGFILGHSQLWLLKTMMFNIRTAMHN